MTWRIAKSLETLRRQINEAYPGRDKSSDGSIGDERHAARTSDHNPWVKDRTGMGVVTAIDTDEDLSPAIHSIESIITAIRESRDPRVKYIIYERRITVAGSELQRWRPYTGPSPHDHHAHISVFPDPRLYDDPREWQISSTAASPSIPTEVSGASNPATRPPSIRLLHLATPLMQGEDVRAVQAALITLGFLKGQADGYFGTGTQAAVRAFQKSKGLAADGVVGQATLKGLGL